MAKVTQFCIGLKNEPGTFANLCGALKRVGVKIRALCVSDDEDCCWVNMVATPIEAVEVVLREGEFNFFSEQILAVEADDRAETMERIARTLAEASINIKYVYGSGESGSSAAIMMSVSDLDAAAALF